MKKNEIRQFYGTSLINEVRSIGELPEQIVGLVPMREVADFVEGQPFPFVMTANTNNTEAGSSAADFLFLPITETGNAVTIDWGDGGMLNPPPYTFQYDVAGVKTVTISDIDGWYLRYNNLAANDKDKILTIESWGSSIEYSGGITAVFNECDFLVAVNATDVPNTSGLTTLQNWFLRCDLLERINNLDNWDLESVVSMGTFVGFCPNFDQEINLNLPSLTAATEAFRNTGLNSPFQITLGASNVNLNGLMLNNSLFNSSFIINNSNLVSNYSNVLRNCTAFNKDISYISIESVTTMANAFDNTALDLTNASLLISKIYSDAVTFNITLVPLGGLNVNITGNNIASGTNTGTGTTLTDAGATFITNGVFAGDVVRNSTTGQYARVVSVDAETQLTLSQAIMNNGDTYDVFNAQPAKDLESLINDFLWTVTGFIPV